MPHPPDAMIHIRFVGYCTNSVQPYLSCDCGEGRGSGGELDGVDDDDEEEEEEGGGGDENGGQEEKSGGEVDGEDEIENEADDDSFEIHHDVLCVHPDQPQRRRHFSEFGDIPQGSHLPE